MTANDALAELENTADVGEAKRELVMRFVRDQESLQTSQVKLKLVDDDTIDLMDSAFSANEVALQQNQEQTNRSKLNDEVLKSGVSEMTLNEEGKGGASAMLQSRLHPSFRRPQSRRGRSKSSSDFRENRKVPSRRINDNTTSPLTVDIGASFNNPNYGHLESDTSVALSSSWPKHILTRKPNTSSCSGKYALYTPQKHLVIEAASFNDFTLHGRRPMSSQSLQRLSTGESILSAHVRKHSASERITCDINQMIESPVYSRCSSPAKSASRRSTRSGRTLMNLGLEPVDPSDIPMLRATSAGKTSLGSSYSFVQLPPITREAPTATPPPSS